MNKFYGPVGVGIALCMSSALLAQEPPARTPATQQPTNTTTTTTTRDTMRNEGDQILVQWLLVDNENEIELSRLAVSRAQAPEVKQFAQKMIDDHTQIVQKLQQFAARTGVGANAADRTGTGRDVAGTGNTGTGNTGTGNTGTGNTGPGATGTGNTGTGNTGTGATGTGNTGNTGTGQVGQGNTGRDPKGEFPATGNRTGMPQDASASRTGSFGAIDHERLIRDLGKQCLESHTKMLSEKQGAEFDRCYMNMALGAHVKAVDTLEVFRNHASPALRPALDEGLRTVQMHLQHAKDLAKRTEQGAVHGK